RLPASSPAPPANPAPAPGRSRRPRRGRSGNRRSHRSAAQRLSVLSGQMRRAPTLLSVLLAALAVAVAPAGAAQPRHGLGFELHADGFWVTAKSPLGTDRVRLMLDRHGEVAYYWAPARIGA